MKTELVKKVIHNATRNQNVVSDYLDVQTDHAHCLNVVLLLRVHPVPLIIAMTIHARKIPLTVQPCLNVQTLLLSYVQMELVSVKESIAKDLRFVLWKNL